MSLGPMQLGLAAAALAAGLWLAPSAGRADPAPANAGSATLVGFGLVAGLNGSGDGLQTSPMTAQSLKAALARDHAPAADLSAYEGQVAAVMVTASFRPDAPAAEPIDLTVSAVGDAKSLAGGRLLQTQLLGADGRVYVTGQGILTPCGGANPQAHGCVSGGGVRSVNPRP